MGWDSFFTIVGQVAISFATLFIIAAALLAVIPDIKNALRRDKPKDEDGNVDEREK
jgi:hypothetical protein